MCFMDLIHRKAVPLPQRGKAKKFFLMFLFKKQKGSLWNTL